MARQPRQQPIGFYGKFQPTGVDDSAAQRMQALAGLGETVASTAIAIGKPIAEAKAAKLGAIEGAKTGRIDEATGELIAPPEYRTFGWGAKAFRTAAESAYLGNVSFEIDQIVKNAKEEFPEDIIGYNNSITASREGLLNAMPEEYAGSARLVFDKLNATASRTIAKAEQIKDIEIMSANIIRGSNVLSDVISNDAYAGNNDDAREGAIQYAIGLEVLVRDGGMKQQEADTFIEALNDRMVIQAKKGEFDRAVMDDSLLSGDRAINGRAIVEELRKNPDETLSAEQNQQLLNTLDVEVTALESANQKAEAKLSQEEMIELADLDIAINLQSLPPSELAEKVNNLFNTGVIKTADGISSRINKINAVSETSRKKNQGIARVANKVKGIEPVGDQPIIPITQQDVDNTYEELTIQGLSTNSDIRGAQQAEFVSRAGYIPKLLKTEIRNGLLSPDPLLVAYAAETMDRIQDIAGLGLNAFTPQESAFANQVNFLSQYMDTEKAIQEAKKITSRENTARVEARTAEIKDDKDTFADSYSSEIDDAFTGFFDDLDGQIAIDDLVADYGQLTESYWKAGFDTVENAKAKAMSQIKANWTKGEFGLMKFSPEKYYALPVTGDTSYVRDELYSELNNGGIDVDIDGIFLISDAETARTASTLEPTYRVMVRTPEGSLESVFMIDQNGNPTDRFQPNLRLATESMQERIKIEAEKGLKPYGRTTTKSYSTLSESQKDKMRETLTSSTSPFALIGKTAKGIASIPSLITPENIKLALDQTGVEFAAGQLSDAIDFVKSEIKQASDDYVASLKRAKGK